MEDQFLDEIYDLLKGDSTETPTLREIIEEKKREFGISSDLQLSNAVDIDKSTLERILNGDTKKVDLFSLLKLDEFFGIGIRRMVQIYVSSLKPEFVGELERARNASFIIRRFDLPGLKKAKIIDSISDFAQIEQRLKEFFRLDSIMEFDRKVGNVLFCKAKSSSDDKMREFWVRSAYMQFEKINKINPHAYNEEALRALLPKIRAKTRNEETGLLDVIQALFQVGVTVIVQSYLTKTQVRGGTFAVKGKPCIVLTDFNKSYPMLWAALLHELYHVLYDFEAIRKFQYHLSGDVESSLLLISEEDADYFGQQMLFTDAELSFISPLITSPVSVASFAKTNKVHPGIIYYFFCLEQKDKIGRNVFGMFQHLFGKADRALQTVLSKPWDKKSIYDEISVISKMYAPEVK